MSDLQTILDAANEIKPFVEPYLSTLIRWGGPVAISAVKALWRKYRDDPPETQRAAVDNFADASKRVSDAMDDIVASGSITEEEVRARVEQPDFLKSLQRLLLGASETDDTLSHEELARLISARLVAAPSSRRNLLLGLAGDAVPRLTGRQIKLLGLMYALYDLGPEDDIRNWDMAQFVHWISVVESVVKPFDDVVYDDVDLQHLEQVGAAAPHRLALVGGGVGIASSRLLSPVNAAWQSLPASARQNAHIVRAMNLMEGNTQDGVRGFASVALTPVGRMLGACAYSIASGSRFHIGDDWDEPHPAEAKIG